MTTILFPHRKRRITAKPRPLPPPFAAPLWAMLIATTIVAMVALAGFQAAAPLQAMDDDGDMPPDSPATGESLDETGSDMPVDPGVPVVEMPPPPDGPDPLASVIRVNSTLQANDPRVPWRKTGINSRSGLGILIQPHKILVTASLIADATHLELEQPESGRKVGARVLAVDYESELAILTTAEHEDADRFFAGTEPVELDDPASVGDQLHIWQIEANGRPVVTPVQLLRIEVGRYHLDTQQLLTYLGQGSLRSHAGSYTVPVMRDGRLSGMVMRYDNNQQLTTILPTPIIRQFLTDLEDGELGGFPNLGIQFSPTLDEQFRRYLGIDDITGGVFVRRVLPGSSAARAGIEVGDVLLAVDNYNIDARGFYEDPVFGRLAMSHLVSGARLVGEEVEAIVWRDGQEVVLGAVLERRPPTDFLVEPHLIDRATPYVICGGLVFQELTEPYLRAFGRNWSDDAPFRLLHAWRNPEYYEEQGWRKLVFLNAVIPTPAVQGYERLSSLILTKANGREIRKIEDLVEAIDHPDNGLHTFEFSDYPFLIHVDAEAAERDNQQVITDYYRIPALSRARDQPLPEREQPAIRPDPDSEPDEGAAAGGQVSAPQATSDRPTPAHS